SYIVIIERKQKWILERKPSQYQYDDGLMDMSICTESWFEDLVKKHHELIEKDDMYIFAIFNKNQQHIGMIDIVTIRRGNFQWAERGYFIHNQHWRKGYAYEALS
ncbi:GNAT family N-acetyltransferase, partial [Staphylococcus pseudintermedius]